MNFNFPLLRPIRIILFPFSLIYFVAIYLRNRLYDKKLLPSQSFGLPIIGVGNIAVGGTGKSPMVEFLIRELGGTYRIATLSRGYKRKTSGYLLADNNTTALDLGDEPMQFHGKFPGLAVAVGEERIAAVPQLLYDRPETQVIILDDAFQHRAISAGYNIILTDYNNLYTRDWFLPTGDLRDEKSSVLRADVIIVTKCPPNLSQEEAASIKEELQPLSRQAIFFSSIQYGALYHIIHKTTFAITPEVEVLLVTGIANPRPIKKMLDEQTRSYEQLVYNDHQIFRIDDLNDIAQRFAQINAKQKIILTTEKDAVRLVKFNRELQDLPVFVLPIEMQFLFGATEQFNHLIGTFIKRFSSIAQASDE